MITFEIYGVGFELSIGEIDKSKFEYWKDKEILEEEASKTNDKFSLFRDHWSDLNDIFHDNGPAMLENTKLEVKENDKIILETYLGAQDLVSSKINFKEYKIEIDTNYYFLGYTTKGHSIKPNLKPNHLKLINYKLFMRRSLGFQ